MGNKSSVRTESLWATGASNHIHYTAVISNKLREYQTRGMACCHSHSVQNGLSPPV